MPDWRLVPPAHQVLPAWDYTLGAEVADLCAGVFKFTPDPEQELILDTAFGVRLADGLPAASRGTVIASRQTVKTSGYEMVCLGWAFLTCEPLILWSAHEFGTAKETFLHMRSLVEDAPWAMRKVRRFYTGGGELAIQMNDGRRMAFVARTTAAGRGKSGPKMIWDEGLELRDEHVGAQDAITSTFPWAQTFIGSSGAKSYSTVLHERIKAGRAGKVNRGFYLEWCDDLPGECAMGSECTHVRGSEGCRLDDERRWVRSNPTVDRIRPDGRGLTLAAIREERAGQPDPMIFARERLTWHQELSVASTQVVSEEAWDGLADTRSRIDGDPLFCLQVSPNRDWSAIVAGGRTPDGRTHLEVTSRKRGGLRLYNRRASTDWVVPWFREALTPRKGKPARFERMTVLVLAGSAAMSLVPALEKIDGLEVVVVPESSLAPACGHLLDQVSLGAVVHVGDPELRASVLALGKRMVGDRAFVWSPRSSSGDITAAMGATLLAWHLEAEGDVDPLNGIL